MVFVQSTTGTRVIDKFQCDRSLIILYFPVHPFLFLVHKTIFTFNEFLAIYFFFFLNQIFKSFFSRTRFVRMFYNLSMCVSLLVLVKICVFVFCLVVYPCLFSTSKLLRKICIIFLIIYIYHCEYRNISMKLEM